jgi:hypothetical protein
MHRSTCARDERCARTDDEGKVLDECHATVHGIDPFLSQESIVHEQPVEKDVDSSHLRFRHG